MGAELQSQNRVDADYEKTTGPIYLKFWQKFLLQRTIKIQKQENEVWLSIFFLKTVNVLHDNMGIIISDLWGCGGC